MTVKDALRSGLDKFANAQVAVVGDVMLDRYWSGSTTRISPEAPVPVVKVNDVSVRIGGSGNVAANIASLGARARLLSRVGEDEVAEIIDRLCLENHISATLLRESGRQTPVKLRVISQHQQLIRLDFEDPIGTVEFSPQFDEAYFAMLVKNQVVVLSDYGKGSISDPQSLIKTAVAQGATVVVDPKGVDFERYRNASLITPNLAEFEAVVGQCSNEREISDKGGALLEALHIDALLVTRGERGMSLLRPGKEMITLPAKTQEVFDVTGAGDTVCAVTAVGLAAGLPIEQAIECANSAAGVVVSKLGTATVTLNELRNALFGTGATYPHSNNIDQVIKALVARRERGERIVMTNGCFDVLHAGHVSYLQQAKAMGDCLVVAVNTDDSVKKLKGNGRPINRLEDRVAVLLGLESIDYVLPFSDPTPRALIEQVAPDILVKGGDYKVDDIVGGDIVRSRGGEVRVLPYMSGRSSSEIIEKIRSGDLRKAEP